MEGKKQKVLIVHNYYQIPGGEDTVAANEKKLLEDHGHEVILYTRNNNELKEMGWLRKFFLPFTTIYNPGTARDVKRIIREQGMDIVHVHNTLHLVSPSVYYAARHCGVPVVQTVHNFRLLCPNALFYRDGHICEDCMSKGLGCAVKHACYRGSKAQTLICVISTVIHRATGIYGKIHYICLTEFNKTKLLGLKQIRQENVFIKPNFVDSCETEQTDRSGFIFAGRLDELKGLRTLIDAWSLMGADAPHLIICGTGPLEEWCADQIKKNRLNAEMKGFIPNDEVKTLIAGSKALILPTLWYEGFPMSILEAYSVGTPVICSDLGNAGSIVEEGVTGWKFEAKVSAALAEKVNKATDISGSVKRVYKEKYNTEANYAELVKIYHTISGMAGS